jgi:hypothetical protein
VTSQIIGLVIVGVQGYYFMQQIDVGMGVMLAKMVN